MGFELLDSVISFTAVMFSLLVIIIILTFFLKLRDIIVNVVKIFIKPVIEKSKIKKARQDNIAYKLSAGLYYVMLLLFILYLMVLFDAPLHGDELPESGSVWSVFIGVIPIIFLFRVGLYFKDEIEEMGRIVNKPRAKKMGK